MTVADRLAGKAHDYEVLAASHSEREALVGAGSTSLLRLRLPSLRLMREVAAALEDELEAA